MRQERSRLWTLQETAEYLGVPPSTLHRMNSRGTGPRSLKVGRHRRYDPLDVGLWLEQRASGGPTQGASAWVR